MADESFVSLYRRFRPGRFDELIGQDHVVRALRSAVRDDRVSHAYLFSGPRGTGKTSSARILAKALNCAAPVDGEPCGQCTSCREITQGTSLDVHELDAASNNGVESMRDLIAHAGLGTPGRWKVYIVDEVHMLSTAAANSLLKTLEEPPGHVIFVLATTDPQKVPDTIRSRTQHLEFRLLPAEALHGLLESVKESAALTVDEATIDAAVRRGKGSARDALSALDQLVASGSADSGRPEITPVLDAFGEGSAGEVLVALSTLLAAGWGPQQLAVDLVDDLRQVFLAALAPELCAVSGDARTRYSGLAEQMGLAKVVRAMELLGQGLVDMRDAPDAQVVLEIAMVRAARPDLDADVSALTERVERLEQNLRTGAPSPRETVSTPEPVPAAPKAPKETAPPPPAPATAPAAAPATEPGRRPSLGAVRRANAAGPPAQPKVTAVPEAEKPSDVAPVMTEPVGTRTGTVTVDRDSLTEAWGNGILHDLPPLVKALYSSGRFVTVEANEAQFALPTAPHRDRCAELSSEVESKLSAHFGTPLRLVLVVDGAGALPSAPPREAGNGGGPSEGRERRRRPEPEPEEFDEEDPAALAALEGDADIAAAAEARLLEAFPGASEVED